MINIIIVEDEKKTAELLKEFIETNEGFKVIEILDSIENTVDYLNKYQNILDLIFLDIQLADGQSFVIFEKISVSVPIIFCTAYNEYMLKAFKNNGIDYILKPFEETDIDIALTKFSKLKSVFSKEGINISEKIQSLIEDSRKYQKSILVNVGEKMVPIQIEEILVFHLENEVIRLYCSENKKYTLFKRMDEIDSIIDGKHFFRINRQMIINRKAVTEIVPFFNRKVIVNTSVQLPVKAIVSRLKVSPFLNWIENPNK